MLRISAISAPVRRYLAGIAALVILTGGAVVADRVLAPSEAEAERVDIAPASRRPPHPATGSRWRTTPRKAVAPSATRPASRPTTTAPPATPAPTPAAPGSSLDPDSAPAPAPGPIPDPASGTATAAAAHGWRLVAADEFDGSRVDTGRWTLYDGAGNGGVGLRRPSAVSQSGGELHITGRGDVSGGMNWRGGRTYGRWEVRARMDRGNGYAPAILLWPSSGRWPQDGEIDLSEIPRGDRRESHFTIHWGAENSQTGFASRGDFTQWHTFAVEWQPDHITFFLDGRAVYTNTDPVAIPRGPMHLAVQNDVGPYNWIPPRDPSTPPEVALHVDWVRIYA